MESIVLSKEDLLRIIDLDCVKAILKDSSKDLLIAFRTECMEYGSPTIGRMGDTLQKINSKWKLTRSSEDLISEN